MCGGSLTAGARLMRLPKGYGGPLMRLPKNYGGGK